MHRGITWIIDNSDNKKTAIELYQLYTNYVEEFGDVSLETFKRYCRDAARCLFGQVEEENGEQESTYIKNKAESQDNLSLEVHSYDLQTKEELLKFANVNMDIWEIERHVISRWGNPQNPQYQLKCWLKRKTHLDVEDYKKIFKNIVKTREREENPKVVYRYSGPKSPEHKIAEIGLADFHFGMQARKEETGQDEYNLRVAENILLQCIEYYIEKLKGHFIDEIIFPVVGDFFNCDFNNSTTKGTPQDEDSTYKDTFQKAQELVIRITERCKEVAPVTWIICEGNHDQYKSFYFSEFLKAWYRNDKRVVVNNSFQKRKFHKWKNNLFMYTHGDTEKFDMLPLRMAQSKKKDFAECDFYYIGIGHLHHKSNGIVRTSIDSNGIEVNILPSLVSASKWESNKWYQHIKECICNLYTTNGKVESWFYHPTAIKNSNYAKTANF